MHYPVKFNKNVKVILINTFNVICNYYLFFCHLLKNLFYSFSKLHWKIPQKTILIAVHINDYIVTHYLNKTFKWDYFVALFQHLISFSRIVCSLKQKNKK